MSETSQLIAAAGKPTLLLAPNKVLAVQLWAEMRKLGLEPDRPRPGNGAWLTNNTMSLPRDLSYATRASGDRFVAQAFVPELQTLRRARTQLRAQTLHAGVVTLPPSAFGAQLEILATFRFPSAEAMSAAAADASQQFGLQVLASNGTAGDADERTSVRATLAECAERLNNKNNNTKKKKMKSNNNNF